MGFAERTVAGLIAVACIVMLLRLALGAKRRHKLDRAVLNTWYTLRSRVVRLYRRQATKKEAKKATEEILQRMRRPVERKGNVITPKAFKRTNGRAPDEKDEEDV